MAGGITLGSRSVGLHPVTPERRTWDDDEKQYVLACIDVHPIALVTDEAETDVLWSLVVRRIERCLRPGDWMCPVTRGQLAVCFGNGAHKVPPSALGIRLASAMGDRLSIGEAGFDLEVAVGIGTGDTGVEPAELAAAAIATSRAECRHIRARAARGATTFTSVAVSHLRSRPVVCRLARREVVAPWVEHSDRARRPEAPSPGVRIEPLASDLHLLVVGAETCANGQANPTVEGLVAVARRLGVTPSIAPASCASEVPVLYQSADAEVVVLALTGASRAPVRRRAVDLGTPWEPWAHTTRELVRLGATVLAVGASVAAIATCVREGAIGLLDMSDFAVQLEKITANLAVRRLARDGNRAERRATTNPGLPQPYDGLVDLTTSEHRVLYQMMRGASATEIADQLSVSLATVRSHIRSILRKLQVSSQLAAVALANGAHQDVINAV
ncbi:MAG TPA: LuxR C-terminal-related transcriptional regulator [Acidimicrobiales bacterium]|nr:LuxR C-terminal-related transcriptional regulator [Acidimicrobiales bacterium]